ncbi:MAG: acyl-CoA dehydrogenase family protein [Myxococcales bacterium]|nr:acyl-CoA dehydrogenase family protein [Myxococcales bacterium]MCB9651456.1 acyl-CoA dehydrogenase family protein [Deltaproteobacteria bacterium]
MRFALDDDQGMIQDAVRRFAEAEVGPKAREVDEAARFWGDALGQLAELGLLAMSIPESAGGSGLDPVAAATAVEELARQDGALAAAVAHHDIAAHALMRAGCEVQRTTWLPRLAGQEALAVYVGAADDLRIEGPHEDPRVSGALSFVPLGAEASLLLVRVRGELVSVDLSTQGVLRSPVQGALGLRGLGWAHLSMEGAKATVAAVDAAAWAEVEAARAVRLSAVSVGLAGAALSAARGYALERKQFRRPIADFQAIQWKLADVATETDAARLMTLRAADLLRRGEPAAAAAAQARLLATAAGVKAGYEAVQIFGGNGFVREYVVERLLRDAKVLASSAGHPADAVAQALLA